MPPFWVTLSTILGATLSAIFLCRTAACRPTWSSKLFGRGRGNPSPSRCWSVSSIWLPPTGIAGRSGIPADGSEVYLKGVSSPRLADVLLLLSFCGGFDGVDVDHVRPLDHHLAGSQVHTAAWGTGNRFL